MVPDATFIRTLLLSSSKAPRGLADTHTSYHLNMQYMQLQCYCDDALYCVPISQNNVFLSFQFFSGEREHEYVPFKTWYGKKKETWCTLSEISYSIMIIEFFLSPSSGFSFFFALRARISSKSFCEICCIRVLLRSAKRTLLWKMSSFDLLLCNLSGPLTFE